MGLLGAGQAGAHSGPMGLELLGSMTSWAVQAHCALLRWSPSGLGPHERIGPWDVLAHWDWGCSGPLALGPLALGLFEPIGLSVSYV